MADPGRLIAYIGRSTTLWAVVPFCIYYNISENRTQDFFMKQTVSNANKKSPEEDFLPHKILKKPSGFHNVFTKCPCGILKGFGDVPQQAFLKFISEIALMCTSHISSEMGECVHECVACYSVKRGFYGGLRRVPAYRRVCAGSNQYR